MRSERLVPAVAVLLIAAGITAACGGSEPAPAEQIKIIPTDSGEMSPEEAGGMSAEASTMMHPPPHGGTPVRFGGAQLELVLDPSSGLLTGYVLDGMGHATVRTTAMTIELEVTPPGGAATPLTLNSTANGLTGDTVGNSSQFGGTLPALKGASAFTGVVKSFTVNGQTYSGVAFSYPSN